MFESNKIEVSKFENFVGKDYMSGGLFRLSTSDLSYNLKVASMVSKLKFVRMICGTHIFFILA